MAKYDAVDQMMRLATEKPTRSAAREEAQVEPAAQSVLEAQLTATEPGLAVAGARGTREPLLPAVQAERVEARQSPTAATPHLSAGERGRQLLGALRPFLPAVGGALRMVDHGAVQAVARLLPLLGSFGLASTANPVAASLDPRETPGAPAVPALALLEQRYAELTEQLKRLQSRTDTLEEQVKRSRDSLERTVTEQGSQAHRMLGLGDRSRLLTAAVIILFMLVVAEMILLGIFMHR